MFERTAGGGDPAIGGEEAQAVASADDEVRCTDPTRRSLRIGGGGVQHLAQRHPDEAAGVEIGRAHVWTPVTNAHLVCRLLLEQQKRQAAYRQQTNPEEYRSH